MAATASATAASNSIALKDLLDLAISSIDPGAVNFNALRKILDILLREANLHNRKIDFQVAESTVELAHSAAPLCDQSSVLERVSKVEQTVQNLLSLPTNQELLDKGAAARRPVADLYQSIKLAGKVETLENAVAKVASLVDDILNQDTSLHHTAALLAADVKVLQRRVSLFGDPDTWNAKLTTWEGLYHAIEGVPHPTQKSLDEGKRKLPTTREEAQTDIEVPLTKKKRKSTPPQSVVMPVTAVSDDAQKSLWPILREMRETKRRFAEMSALIDTKADKKDLKSCRDQVDADITMHSTRTEQLFQDNRQLRTDLDNLARSFDEYSDTRRHTIRRSTLAPTLPSFHCLPEVKRSQGCTVSGTAQDCCPPGTPTEPVISHSLLKLQNLRFDNIEGELEKFRKKLDDIQKFIDQQILNLSEKQVSLERDIVEVIQLFKERRRPTLKVTNLDMNVVEKMLDDYERIVEEMKTHEEFGKQLGHKTDRLFYLCDDLKRNKADSRTVKDALDMKADSEDLREKAGRAIMEEFIRSQGFQMEAVAKQVQNCDSLLKKELGNFLETLSTRASQGSLEELRSFVKELTENVKICMQASAPKKYAAATSCNVQCLSCGDEVQMEPRNDTLFAHPYFPAREVISPFISYGRNRDLPDVSMCAPRRLRPTSCSVSPRRSPRTYTSLIDARHEDVRKYKDSLRTNHPEDQIYLASTAAGRYCVATTPRFNVSSGRPLVTSLSQSNIAQKIADIASTAKKNQPVIAPKRGRGKR
ncbi:hypothetical protein BV898_12789 [Hypsibius exemplaris]|uniref:DUF4795 domain-containing protein n=1 Tax=Hypsibius exemplaris TaxID=2072580 RepID=A0A1W0WCL7_HYPEX|nr:hypothetical protein BV898_12789 [Hypsibius exemplaris]